MYVWKNACVLFKHLLSQKAPTTTDSRHLQFILQYILTLLQDVLPSPFFCNQSGIINFKQQRGISTNSYSISCIHTDCPLQSCRVINIAFLELLIRHLFNFVAFFNGTLLLFEACCLLFVIKTFVTFVASLFLTNNAFHSALSSPPPHRLWFQDFQRAAVIILSTESFLRNFCHRFKPSRSCWIKYQPFKRELTERRKEAGRRK